MERWSIGWSAFLLLAVSAQALRCPVPSARDPGRDNCPRSWYREPGTNMCYRFSDFSLRYDLATNKCRQFGGDLVSIHTMAENDYVRGNLNGASWIGLNSVEDGSTFEWTDGSPVDFLNWGPGEPSSEDEKCVEMMPAGADPGKWNDNDCQIEMPFVCALDLEAECASLSSACDWDGSTCVLRGTANEEIGYQIGAPMESIEGPGFRILLQTTVVGGSPLYGPDFDELYFEARYHSETHLELKIYPANEARYEVPIPLNIVEGEWENALYEVILRSTSAGDPFDFYVRRKDTGVIIMENGGPLIFEDQFLQMSTKLPSEKLFGFGENIHETFRHRFEEGMHRTTPIFTRDLSPFGGDLNSYGAQPYYQVTEDDDGNSHGVLFLNSNAMEYETEKISGVPHLTLRTIGGLFDFHILMGPSMIEVTQQYTDLIGRPFIPPYWSLGFQICRWGYQNLDEVRDVVDRTRSFNIPQDVQYVDIDYMEGRKDFTLDEINFGELPEYVEEVRAEGIHFVVILDPPLIIDFTDDYPPAKRGYEADVWMKWPNESFIPDDQEPGLKDYMVGYMWPDNKTVFPDYFKQSTKDWWIDEVERLHDLIAWDAIWIDMNEVTVFGTNEDRPENWPEGEPDWSLKCPPNNLDNPPYPTAHVSDDSNVSGTMAHKSLCLIAINVDDTDPQNVKVYNQYDVHSLYGWSQAEPTWIASRSATGHRSMVFSRSTYPGVGKYIGHWYGDNFSRWVDLRRSIIAMFEFNLFGFPYGGSDICGFFSETNERLCLRWQQVGAFYPFARNHNAEGNIPQDPGQWPSVAEATRISMEIRYRLLPLLYTLFYEAHVFGTPVIRPLLTNFPGDQTAIDVDDQFMWGDSLLISPIVYEESYNERQIYLPQGVWYDYHRGTALQGPLTTNVYPDDMEIPLHLRGGKIIPAQGLNGALNTDQSRLNPFQLIVAPDSSGFATGNMFWDDGQSQDTVETNAYFTAEFVYTADTLQFTPSDVGGIIGGETIGALYFYGIASAPTDVVSTEGTIIGFGYDADQQLAFATCSIPMNVEFFVALEF